MAEDKGQEHESILEGLRRAWKKAGVDYRDLTGVVEKDENGRVVVAENPDKSMKDRRAERNTQGLEQSENEK